MVDAIAAEVVDAAAFVGMERPAERGAPSWPLAVTQESFFATGEKTQLAMDSRFDWRVYSLQNSFEKKPRSLHVVYRSPARR